MINQFCSRNPWHHPVLSLDVNKCQQNSKHGRRYYFVLLHYIVNHRGLSFHNLFLLKKFLLAWVSIRIVISSNSILFSELSLGLCLFYSFSIWLYGFILNIFLFFSWKLFLYFIILKDWVILPLRCIPTHHQGVLYGLLSTPHYN